MRPLKTIENHRIPRPSETRIPLGDHLAKNANFRTDGPISVILLVWFGMVKMAKHANFWTEDPISLSAGPNEDIETCLVWFGKVKLVKNANFWTNGPIWVIFLPRYQLDQTKTLRHVWYSLVLWNWPQMLTFEPMVWSGSFFSPRYPHAKTLSHVWYGEIGQKSSEPTVRSG